MHCQKPDHKKAVEKRLKARAAREKRDAKVSSGSRRVVSDAILITDQWRGRLLGRIRPKAIATVRVMSSPSARLFKRRVLKILLKVS